MVTRRTRILLGVVLLVVAMINIVVGLWIGVIATGGLALITLFARVT
ncbi:MAG: hypothetical protein QOJ19_3245 [Acidimicrobiia bacterium]|nr:hypothetical protein [Acidimicrobiia bacterium]